MWSDYNQIQREYHIFRVRLTRFSFLSLDRGLKDLGISYGEITVSHHRRWILGGDARIVFY